MNPTALHLRNYRTFESLDLDLPAGCVGVLGLNGAGKSSIVNAVDLALFGPEGRSWAPYLTVGADSTELMVELEFDHASETYRVRRGYSARAAGKSTLDLEKRFLVAVTSTPYGEGESRDWRALTLGSAKETQALLEQILGFTRRTLRASSLLLQGDGAAFTEADPRDRKKILADTLGLDRWETLRAAVRRDLRAAEQEVARIDGRLEGVTREGLEQQRAAMVRDVEQRTATITLATTALTSWEGEVEKAAQAVQAAKEADGARAALVANRDAAQAAFAVKQQVVHDANLAEKDAAAVQDQLRSLPAAGQMDALEQREQQLVAAVEAYNAVARDHEDAVKLYDLRLAEKRTVEAQATQTDARAAALDEKIKHLESGELDKCPTCEQLLGAEARKATVGSLRAQAQSLAEETQALRERAAMIELPAIPDLPGPVHAELRELDGIRAQARAAREAEVQRSRLEERFAGFQRAIDAARSPAFRDEFAAARLAADAANVALEDLPAPVDVAALEQAAAEARGRVQVERERLQAAERDKAVAQERLDQLTARAEQLEQGLAARERHLAEIELLAILDRAYGPDGIPALIVENAAIPAIEVEANRILVELTGTTAGCRVELRTDRAKQDGGIRDDVLDVVVITEAGERAYETFSGGERTRLNLALRIALARLLATRRGAESRVLAIDEPEFLDEDGTAALVDVLRELEQTGVFDRVYLVSHVPALRDSFDVVLQVVKDADGRSRVEDALAEAVAA